MEENSKTTTDHFQKLPTFYRSSEECNKYDNPQTNPRYENFNQFSFTAGDIEQFEMYRDSTNGTNRIPDIRESNVWIGKNVENVDWQKYRNLTSESVDTTFRYIFDKFKKGLFIKIKNNQLAVFLPFSKHNYVNEWSSYINHPPEYKTMSEFLVKAAKDQGFSVNERKIPDTSLWYGNNCLVRYDGGENDRGMSNLKDMFVTLCKTRSVPDIELFVNKRDFPIITKKDAEPYEHIYGYENMPLLSHSYGSYCPILSNVTTNIHADIPIPTAEDWARVSSQEDGKFFAPDCKTYNYDFSIPWEARKPTAVFRGASTGCGTTVETNPRLRIASMVSPNENGALLLDAGITKWNLRPRKHISSPYLKLIDQTQFKTVKPLTPSEQAGYKYIVNIDGHVSAFRLSLELSMGSVIFIADMQPQVASENDQSKARLMLKLPPDDLITESILEKAFATRMSVSQNVDDSVKVRAAYELLAATLTEKYSKYRMWFRKHLVAYEHYVPIKADCSDLFEKIRWCRQNDDKCKKIADNARAFYQKYLTKDGVLDYLQLLFNNIKQVTGTYFYNSITPPDIIYNYQMEHIRRIQGSPVDVTYTNDTINFHFTERNYYAMEALQMVLREMGGIKEHETRTIHKSRDTHNYTSSFIHSISNRKILMKQTSRHHEFANESFCGISEINALIRDIPNFRYTYYADFSKSILMSEHIEGVTFKEFIQNGCTMSEFVSMLVMINMAIAVAQERIGFVHYDLVPWNIIIVTHSQPQKITYHFHNYVFNVQTRYVPVIIDYGRSHVISTTSERVMHHGIIDQFKMTKMQDCFMLLVSSVHEMVSAIQRRNRFVPPSDGQTLLSLINFLAGTKFQRKPLASVQEMINFLSVNKKYNELIYGNKCDLEQYKTSVEFIEYVITNSLDEKTIKLEQLMLPQKVQVPVYHQKHFYYDLITGASPRANVAAYLKSLTSDCIPKLHEIALSKNDMIVSYTMSKTSLCVNGIKQFVTDYLKRDPEIVAECDDILRMIDDIYNNVYNTRAKIVPFHVPYYSTTDQLLSAKYTSKSFSNPSQILSLLQAFLTTVKRDELLVFREMFVFTSFYNVPYKLNQTFFDAHKRILALERLPLLNHNATIESLKFMSREIYSREVTELTKMEHIPQKTFQTITDILNIF